MPIVDSKLEQLWVFATSVAGFSPAVNQFLNSRSWKPPPPSGSMAPSPCTAGHAHRAGSLDEVTRRSIQASGDSVRAIARRFGVSPTTVQKWRKREDARDRPRGSNPGERGLISPAYERAIALFRRQTLLPLDDCLYALRSIFPTLSRSTFHRCLQRRGLGSLANVDGRFARGRIRNAAIGDFCLGVSNVRLRDAAVFGFIAYDRVSKIAFGRLMDEDSEACAVAFLRELASAYPFVHTINTSDDVMFVGGGRAANGFALACSDLGLEHRVIQLGSSEDVAEPDGGNEEMTPTGGVTRVELEQRLAEDGITYNCKTKLKSLGGRTPAEYVSRCLSSSAADG